MNYCLYFELVCLIDFLLKSELRANIIAIFIFFTVIAAASFWYNKRLIPVIEANTRSYRYLLRSHVGHKERVDTGSDNFNYTLISLFLLSCVALGTVRLFRSSHNPIRAIKLIRATTAAPTTMFRVNLPKGNKKFHL